MATKQEILDALERHEYKVTIEAPNNVGLCHHPDGSEFYVVYADDCKFGVDAGSCTVEVCDEVFTCDLGEGYWDIYRDDEDEEQEIIDALGDLPDVLCGEMTDTDSQIEVFEKANGVTCNEYYFCEDPDCPKDVADMCSLSDLNFPKYLVDDEEVYLTDEEADEDGWYYGILEGTDPDDNGCFACVMVQVEDDEPTAWKDCDSDVIFNPDEGIEK